MRPESSLQTKGIIRIPNDRVDYLPIGIAQEGQPPFEDKIDRYQ